MRIAALAALLLVASPASAVEGETTLSLSGRFMSLGLTRSGDDLDGRGGGLVGDYGRAVSDSLWLRVAAGGGALSMEGELTGMGLASAGVTWAVDVLKYVPYIGIGGGLVVAGGGPLDALEVEPYIELGVGLDVIVSTSFSWGIDARLSSFAGSATLFLLGPRLSWHWGYF